MYKQACRNISSVMVLRSNLVRELPLFTH